MSSHAKKAPRRSFRAAMESGTEDDGYEPQQLWLIPIYLRSRHEHSADYVKRIRKLIDEGWQMHGGLYGSRDEYEQTEFVDWLWRDHSPPWWGLNDIVGWIDVRVCVRIREIQAVLFLPMKRVSRQLKDKRYVLERMETCPLGERGTNEGLRQVVTGLVDDLATDEKVKKRYIDLEQWKLLLDNTDIMGVIYTAAERDYAKLMEEQDPNAEEGDPTG